MTEALSIDAFAVVPSNDLAAAVLFWERLGFSRAGGEDHYVIMSVNDRHAEAASTDRRIAEISKARQQASIC